MQIVLTIFRTNDVPANAHSFHTFPSKQHIETKKKLLFAFALLWIYNVDEHIVMTYKSYNFSAFLSIMAKFILPEQTELMSIKQ